ncbi:hypothetical protein AB4K20DRAFT_1844428 [Rhizopus microsporus]
MKFTSFLSAVLVFTIFTANAENEPAVLQFLPAPRIFPPIYRIRADLLLSRTSHEIILRTREPNWIATYPERTRGVVDYNKLSNGRYEAVINDNYAKGGYKTFRIDLIRPGVELHYEGSSVTDELIEDLPADGDVRAIDEDDLRYDRPRLYASMTEICSDGQIHHAADTLRSPNDYRSFPQREIRDIVYYIAQSLANNASMSSFQINTLSRCVHSVAQLMKLCPTFSLVVLTKSRYGQWLSISSFLCYPARLLKLNSQC